MQQRDFLSPSADSGSGTNTNRRRKCSSCSKPLGSTVGKCHECGGKTPRGTPEDGHQWRVLLGVA